MRTKALRPLVAGSVLLVGAILTLGSAKAQDSSGTRAVPTYEAAGLYWSAPGANEANGCNVQAPGRAYVDDMSIVSWQADEDNA